MKSIIGIGLFIILLSHILMGQQSKCIHNNPDTIYKQALSLLALPNEIEKAISLFTTSSIGFKCKKECRNWLKSNYQICALVQKQNDPIRLEKVLDNVFNSMYKWNHQHSPKEAKYLFYLYGTYITLLEKIGQYQKAFKIAKEAEKVFPNKIYLSTYSYKVLHEVILHTEGRLAHRLGDFKLAKTIADTLCHYYLAKGNFEQATNERLLSGTASVELKAYSKALKLYQEALNWAFTDSAHKGRLLNNIGYAYYKAKKYPKSIIHAQKALFIYQKIIQTQKPNPNLLSSKYETHNLLALAYQKKENFQEANNHFLQALACVQARHKTLHRVETLRSSVYQGRLYLHDLKNTAKALEIFHKGLVYGIPNFSNENIYTNPSDSSIKNLDPFIVHALAGKANSLIAMYEANKDTALLKLAIQTFDQAFSLEEQLKLQYTYNDSKFLAGETHRPYYEQAIYAAYHMYHFTKDASYLDHILQFMERNKAFVLWEAMNKASIGKTSGLTEADKRLKFYSLDEVRQTLKNEETFILEYFVGENYLFALTINQVDAGIHMLERKENLEEEVSKYVNFIAQGKKYLYDRRLKPSDYYHEYIEKGTSWYETFLKPLVRQENIAELVIIPDGILSNLPFETFLNPSKIIHNADQESSWSVAQFKKLPYLLKDSRIRYGYSMNTLIESSAQQHDYVHTYAGFAPTYEDGEMRKIGDTILSLPALKMIPKRIKYIADVIDGKAFLDVDANIFNFEQFTQNTNILHLMMHGGANDSLDLFSWLAFHKDSTDQAGILLASDIYLLNIQSNLLILTACESGKGRIRIGEGKMSLARAFMQAGCPNIVNSLWDADQNASVLIMEAYLKYLQKGLPLDQALQQAKLDYIDNTESFLPYYWSNFVLIGSDNVIVEGGLDQAEWKTIILWVLGFVAGVILLRWLYFRKR